MPSPTSMSYGYGDMNGDLLPDVIVEGRGITDEWWKGVSNDSLYSYYECKDVNGNYSNVKVSIPTQVICTDSNQCINFK